ncbi:MAG: MFS transporter [Pusillimonas sp.]
MTRLQKTNVMLLAGGQSLFTITTITTMALSSVIGQQLAPSPGLATLPAAMMMLSTLLTTLLASLLMKRIGRRRGFIIGTLNGAMGGLVCFASVAWGSFALLCLGNFFIGLYQSFAMYYRFAATDATAPEFRSRAVSYVMIGGLVAAVLGPLNARITLDWVPSVPYGGPFLVILVLAVVAGVLINRITLPEPGSRKTSASAADAAPLQSTGHINSNADTKAGTDAKTVASTPAGTGTTAIDPALAARPLATISKHPGFFPAMLCSGVCFAFMAMYMTVTPLAMQAQGFDMTDTTIVIQTQVLSMFGPAFVTGGLIARHGLNRIMLTGAVLMLLASLTGAFADTVPVYMLSRLCLGIGWNFLFVGSAVLLSTTHRAAERGKVQGLNDQFMFFLVTIACVGAAPALHSLGWQNLNLLAGLPVLVALVALVIMVRQTRRRPGS